MKKAFLLSLVVIFFCFSTGALNAMEEILAPSPGATISMDLKDASLKDVLKILSIQSGMNFIASEAVADRTLTLYLDKIPLKEAMDKIFIANNLTYDMDKQANIFLVKDWGKPQIETVTKVFYLKHATVSSSSLKEEMKNNVSGGGSVFGSTSGTSSTSGSSGSSTTTGTISGKWNSEDQAGITKAVSKLLTPQGTLIEDYRTNSLIVTDVPSRMPVVEQVIAALDIPIPQIMLEVEMLDVSKDVLDKIGFKYGQSPFTVTLAGGHISTGFPFESWENLYKTATAAHGTLGINEGDTGTYKVIVDFLTTQTDTKMLARPKILTLNNETAEIKIVTNEAIGVTTTSTGAGGTGLITAEAERQETGVSLRVTPQVNPDNGEITMFIMPSVSDATQKVTLTSTGSAFPATFVNPETRYTKSTVKINDGDTVILGGLIRNDKSEVITKLPFLGDIPFLGKLLFTNRSTSPNRERELLVFITPHIVKDNNVNFAKAGGDVSPTREQDTVSGFDRQTAVSSSLDKFEKK